MDAICSSCGTRRVLGGPETSWNSQAMERGVHSPKHGGVSLCMGQGAGSRNEPSSASTGPQDTQSSRGTWSNHESEQSRSCIQRSQLGPSQPTWPPSPLLLLTRGGLPTSQSREWAYGSESQGHALRCLVTPWEAG